MQFYKICLLLVSVSVFANPTGYTASPEELSEQRTIVSAWKKQQHKEWSEKHLKETGGWESQESYQVGKIMQMVHEAYRLEYHRLKSSGAGLTELANCNGQFRKVLNMVSTDTAWDSDATTIASIQSKLSCLRIFMPGGPTWIDYLQLRAEQETRQTQVILCHEQQKEERLEMEGREAILRKSLYRREEEQIRSITEIHHAIKRAGELEQEPCLPFPLPCL